LEIEVQRFEIIIISAPHRIGYSKIFPNIKISVGEQDWSGAMDKELHLVARLSNLLVETCAVGVRKIIQLNN
jgi:hypothetical protein